MREYPIQFLRNKHIYENFDEAETSLNALAETVDLADGEPILIRYYANDKKTDVNVLMGISTKVSDDEKKNYIC